MKEISVLSPTHGNHFALIDDEDFEDISKYKWFITVCNGKKYPATKYNKSQITMHRMVMKSERGQIVDHVDHNSFNNQKYNLRHCTQQQNCRNSSKRKGASSRYKGVCYFKANGRYIAHISVSGKNKYLGYFDDEASAAREYNKHAKAIFGEFANLNNIIND